MENLVIHAAQRRASGADGTSYQYKVDANDAAYRMIEQLALLTHGCTPRMSW